MITTVCAATGRVERHENKDAAFSNGWLRVSVREDAPADVPRRTLWFAPGQHGQWAEVFLREGIATRERLEEIRAAAALLIEGRVRD